MWKNQWQPNCLTGSRTQRKGTKTWRPVTPEKNTEKGGGLNIWRLRVFRSVSYLYFYVYIYIYVYIIIISSFLEPQHKLKPFQSAWLHKLSKNQVQEIPSMSNSFVQSSQRKRRCFPWQKSENISHPHSSITSNMPVTLFFLVGKSSKVTTGQTWRPAWNMVRLKILVVFVGSLEWEICNEPCSNERRGVFV